jgi:hypothetical protein
MPSCVMNGLIVHTRWRLRDETRVSARCSLRTPVQLVYEPDMSKLYFELAFVGGLVACGSNSSNSTDAPKAIDAKVYLDAPGSGSGSGSGSCTMGSNFGFGSGVGSANADLTCNADCTGANKLGTATTDCNGNFSTSVTLGGTAVDGYINVAATGNVTTLGYPGEALATNSSVQTLVFPTSLLALLGDVIPACASSTTKGLIGVLVTDCAGNRITDTTDIKLTSTQGGVAAGSVTDISTLAPALAGFFLVCGVTPGSTDLNVTYLTKTYLKNTVTVVGGEATEAIIRPGY